MLDDDEHISDENEVTLPSKQQNKRKNLIPKEDNLNDIDYERRNL